MIYIVSRTSEMFESVNPVRGTFRDKVTSKRNPDWPEETILFKNKYYRGTSATNKRRRNNSVK